MKSRFHKRGILTSVLVGLVGINTLMQAQVGGPRLVVGITVDQLRTDYLDYLQSMFSEKGFKRLINRGVYLRDVDFRRSVNNSATAAAVVYTGNWPGSTGLSTSKSYDPQTQRSVDKLTDSKYPGNYTSDGYSPAGLRLSTIADEIMIDGGGLSNIYSIAPDAQTAIVMSGHAGSGAAWIDDNNGKWASTTYYKKFPQPLATANQYRSLSTRIDTITWKPSRAINSYPGLPLHKKYYSFSHTFPRSDRDAFRRFKVSAPVNQEITDAAIECLKQLGLGKGAAIDMLNLSYTAAPWTEVRDGDVRIELEDTYLRLDDQIGRLLDEIDRTVGLDNVVVILSSTGYYDEATTNDPKYQIPGGEISLKRMESLLNSYLSARHGNGDYVNGVHDDRLYLSAKAIESKGLRIEEIRQEAREFLQKMSGISSAVTIDEIFTGSTPEAESLQLRVDPKEGSDIILSYTPGWTVVNDISYPQTKQPVRYSQALTPAILMAPGIISEEISTPVDATAIAPTVSSVLHIRSPNGAISRPHPLRVKK
ncbi:MAG: alkaline phosphatase family protein [Clostridium sp.]|nr:alkaline phosphatase family protein [Prevotella sp.]MCM1428906.1 alkaline phosphatase family protein [Clostridium sp.]